MWGHDVSNRGDHHMQRNPGKPDCFYPPIYKTYLIRSMTTAVGNFHCSQNIFTTSKSKSLQQNHYHYSKIIITAAKPLSMQQKHYHCSENIITTVEMYSSREYYHLGDNLINTMRIVPPQWQCCDGSENFGTMVERKVKRWWGKNLN